MTKCSKIIISLFSIVAPIVYAELPNSSAPIAKETTVKSCIPGQPETSPEYFATKWYRTSAERNAEYNEIFTLGLEKIEAQVKKQQLAKGSWGVILDIDETVLDNSQYEKEKMLACESYNVAKMYAYMEKAISKATPGAKNLTCNIQKLGGKVVLVTNRDGTFDNKIQAATIANLHSVGICFDNVIFANGNHDSDKTPRFEAVNAGNYQNIISMKKLPKLNIVAYFGDNIQDFPNIKQAQASKEDPNGEFYQQFGQKYFSLPNPTYGSWEKNQFN